MKHHKIVFINGPKRSGKDTARTFISKWCIMRHYKMTTPMDRAIPVFFSIDEKTWKRLREVDKDTPAPELWGYSPREVLIWFSEEVMKPKFGSDVFGRQAATNLPALTSLMATVIDDCGFYDEALPNIRRFRPENCLLLRINREGCEWDSRGPVDLQSQGVQQIDIDNRHDLHMYEVQVNNAVQEWMGYDNQGSTGVNA